MQGIIDWVVANSALIFGVLWALSEVLALIPSVKANSVFQLVYNFLKKKKEAAPVQAIK